MFRTIGSKIKRGFVKAGNSSVEYFKGLLFDYKIVATDTINDIRAKPAKGVVAFSLLGTIIYAIKTNPNEEDYMTTVVSNQTALVQVADSIRNPDSTANYQQVTALFNQHRLRRLDLILFSVIWRADYNRDCDLYAAQCKQLKPNWRDIHKRVIDIGAFNRWIMAEKYMRDYDVNPSEYA